MNRVKSLWDQEPAMFLAVIQAGIALVTAFGLELTGPQIGGIMAFSAAVLGFITRQKVSPTDTSLRVPTSKLPALFLIAALGASASCAKVTPPLIAGEKTVRAVVLQATNTVEPLVCNAEARKALTPKPCLQLLDALEPAVDLAIAYNRALREGKPPAIAETIQAIDKLIAAIKNVIPDGPAKATALQDLVVARVRAEGGK